MKLLFRYTILLLLLIGNIFIFQSGITLAASEASATPTDKAEKMMRARVTDINL
ncbi:hypothetical protein [Desulfosporosinus shakirovi]|uniref:hypothetical protein n=1 Tax=Desulfosporosinus shakirovi TaxID=2885154 RepID=UPI001E64A3E9|nr:hypothetical protein [Desulfosporosinus sp. SRJS8]MCB8817081.1 hypothetical protein [Desulfosporosinus sp. SRJS8]